MVIELIKKDTKDCSTSIGKLIGLEPVCRASIWRPAIGDIDNRSVEGEYHLISMPTGQLEPAPFNTKGMNAYSEVQATITNLPEFAQQDWEKWLETYAPKPSEIPAYIENIGLDIPLENFMTRNLIRDPSWYLLSITPEPLPDLGFEWPETITISNACVASHLNRAPSLPTSLLLTDEQKYVERYLHELKLYYDRILADITLDGLKPIRHRRIDNSGRQLKGYNTKKAFLEAIQTEDKQIITLRYKKLLSTEKSKLNELINNNDYDCNKVIKHSEQNIEVTKDQFSNMCPEQALRKEIMVQYCNLFNAHKKKLRSMHAANRTNIPARGINRGVYCTRPSTLFLSPDIFDKGCTAEYKSNYAAIADMFDHNIFRMYYVFVIIHKQRDDWSLLKFDINKKCMVYFDPHFDYRNSGDHPFAETLKNIAMDWLKGAATTEQSKLDVQIPWQLEVYPGKAIKDIPAIITYEPLLHDCNTSTEAGIYIIYAMDMLYRDIPLNIKVSDTTLLRERYMHCLVQGNLPHY